MRRLLATLRFGLSLVCFVAALLLAGAGVRTVHPYVEIKDWLQMKLRYLAKHRAEYDTLVFGSSHINRQVNPATFDAENARLGRPTRTFNAANDAMAAPEDSYFLERVLAPDLRPPGLKYVFLEISNYNPTTRIGDEVPKRTVSWHDFTRTRDSVRQLIPETDALRQGSARKRRDARRKFVAKLKEAWPEMAAHLRAYAIRTVNLGEGAEWLGPRLISRKEKPLAEMEAPHGYAPLIGMPKPEDMAENEARMAIFRQRKLGHRPLKPLAQKNLDRMLALIRATGAEPIVVNAPIPMPVVYTPAEHSRVRFLDFSDMKRYPELFQPEYKQDWGHLNAAGAELYSAAISRQWLEGGAVKKD